MSEKNLQSIRGTQDIFGKNLEIMNQVIDVARCKARIFGYQEIITPIFENSNVFFRTLGDTSDIVSKETYTFLDRDKTSITLRPELTAPIVRAAISNNLLQDLPLKLFSAGPLFRHERPQKARYRQFNQVSYEFFGSDSIASDVETIAMADSIIEALGICDTTELNINSMGDIESRKKYELAIKDYLGCYKTSLSHESKIRLERNPLRILDSKDKTDQEILNGVPKIIDFLSKEVRSKYERLLSYLHDIGIKYKQNHKLVRGLDYYTGVVFEIITDNLGSQGTVIAGGRYDELVSAMGGSCVPAIGFALGVERLAALLETRVDIANKKLGIPIIPIGEDAEEYSIKLIHSLRSFELPVYIDYGLSLKKRMQKANKRGADFVIIFGDSELTEKNCIVKNMTTGIEQIVKFENLPSYFEGLKV
ncbi:histidine--tRNA ligase [Candidatus Lariskella endosymbiont of Hedychridium roseum]|uniref:histidine--tRNA ligase n=1 Tax=Candidatus Lariskella endosymbiont of Hedychridium roseum TaxID=3077949 RepID=UPI0030D39DB3